jgi:hypothetical protein
MEKFRAKSAKALNQTPAGLMMMMQITQGSLKIPATLG